VSTLSPYKTTDQLRFSRLVLKSLESHKLPFQIITPNQPTSPLVLLLYSMIVLLSATRSPNDPTSSHPSKQENSRRTAQLPLPKLFQTVIAHILLINIGLDAEKFGKIAEFVNFAKI
jgi:hypothetical protein